eukprot:TRINITY_DN153_c0_g1_i1.p1 TRINITY_DN153_c0_g1~~TRINITY_DN153_c0_g1_i1.p1  ORF type:complete len:267 (+),score=72.23 TRINITY_DN153_c0_g1_i1:192-992(+)
MTPTLKFTNAAGDVGITSQSAEIALNTGLVHYKVTYSGSFVEVMELKRFPFDRQVLHIKFMHDYELQPRYSVRWEKHKNQEPQITQNCQDREWDGCTPKIVFPSEEESKLRTQSMSINGQAERLSSYFMWNVVFVLFLIVSMSFLTFEIPPEDGVDRFGLNLTLVLTSTTYKYVIAGYLPKTTYLTLLDKYVLLGFVCLFLVVVQNTIATALSAPANARLDYISLFVLVPGWLLINAFLLLGAILGFFRQDWKDVETQQEGGGGGP